LSAQLGTTYKTAWYMLKRIRAAMGQRDETHQLTGTIDLDDAYFGGPVVGKKRGRGTEKAKVFVALSLDNQPTHFYDIKKEGNPAVLCQEKTSKNEWWYVAASEKQHQRAIYNHPSQNLSMQSLCQQSTCLN